VLLSLSKDFCGISQQKTVVADIYLVDGSERKSRYDRCWFVASLENASRAARLALHLSRQQLANSGAHHSRQRCKNTLLFWWLCCCWFWFLYWLCSYFSVVCDIFSTVLNLLFLHMQIFVFYSRHQLPTSQRKPNKKTTHAKSTQTTLI
jgi:hypothetical protein